MEANTTNIEAYILEFKKSLEHIDYRKLSSGFIITVGVILGILASLITCLGLNLQKLSLCDKANEKVPSWKQPRWIAGFACVLVGSILDFVAFGLAPQSLLAPLAALSLIWNLFLASSLLNEKYTLNDVVATVLILIGTGFTIIFASHVEKGYSLEQLKSLYAKDRMLIYGIIVPSMLLFHYYLIHSVSKSPIITSNYRNKSGMVGYAGFAGIAGGQSVLFAKSTIELIKDASHGNRVFYDPVTYLIILMMIGSLLIQISFLNGGLKGYDALKVIPVYQSYWILSSVLGGLVYFGEYEDLNATQLFWFFLGLITTFVGLAVLTYKDHNFAFNIQLQLGSKSCEYIKVNTDEESFEEFGLPDDDSEVFVEENTPGNRKDNRDEESFEI